MIRKKQMLAAVWMALFAATSLSRAAEGLDVVVGNNPSPQAQYGAEKVLAALKEAGIPATRSATVGLDHSEIAIGPADGKSGQKPQGFVLSSSGGSARVAAYDDAGLVYGCLELAARIRAGKKLPDKLNFSDAPSMIVRGTCIGMQKTYLLPGRKVYEYPYTTELFPWFYDKAFWTEYLDFLADHRMNALYIWNGHPFASLVRVPDYPYAVEVSDEQLAKNQETFKYIVDEANRRGIMVMQMFYNIIVSKPFAEKNNLPSTQFAAPTPLLADYTKKSIAEFVKTYPHAGLMVCLGEAQREGHTSWMVDTIIGGIHEGMKEAGITKDIPLMLRTHAMPAEEVIPEVIKHYPTLYTESKYNGESLTTWQPRGRWRDQHLLMSKLGAIHSINVHILANLEPFRYGAQRFIKLCVQAAEDTENAKGIHLYPLCYWNWPDSADKVGAGEQPLKQIQRDWIWFDAWSRYAWNPRIDEKTDHAYWVGKLADMYGSPEAGDNILAAYNDSGECAPRILRRFGITEGNRQTMSLGMTLDELVRPEKYGEFTGLWEWQSPPGERLKVYAEREWKKEPHEGETPPQIIREVLEYSQKAVAEIDAAAPLVTRNKQEFARLRNDVHAIRAMSQNYSAKAEAAMDVLRYGYSKDVGDMEKAEAKLEESLEYYKQLAALTKDTYNFANSMQTSQRKIPVVGGVGGQPANYHWTQLVPVYEKELADFRKEVLSLKEKGGEMAVAALAAAKEPVKRLPKVGINPTTKDAEIYPVQVGSKVFADKDAVIESIAPELVGLNGVRFPVAIATGGKLELDSRAPVQLLVGYFREKGKEYLQVPNTDVDAGAAATIDTTIAIENAAKISGMPPVDVHVVKFDRGKRALDLHGSGLYVILGVIPPDVKIPPHDAKGGVSGAAGGAGGPGGGAAK